MPLVVAARLAIMAVECEEVVAVVGDNRAPVTRRVFEQLVVGEAAELGEIRDSEDVMASIAELLRDHGGQHLVAQKLHASASRSRRHCASAASASSTWRPIRSSISSRYSP